jgi:hypothetical protein
MSIQAVPVVHVYVVAGNILLHEKIQDRPYVSISLTELLLKDNIR